MPSCFSFSPLLFRYVEFSTRTHADDTPEAHNPAISVFALIVYAVAAASAVSLPPTATKHHETLYTTTETRPPP